LARTAGENPAPLAPLPFAAEASQRLHVRARRRRWPEARTAETRPLARGKPPAPPTGEPRARGVCKPAVRFRSRPRPKPPFRRQPWKPPAPVSRAVHFMRGDCEESAKTRMHFSERHDDAYFRQACHYQLFAVASLRNSAIRAGFFAFRAKDWRCRPDKSILATNTKSNN